MSRIYPHKPNAPVRDPSESKVVFQPLCEADLPMLLRWLQEPHVLTWWDDGDDTLAKVRKHNLEKPKDLLSGDLPSAVQRFIIHIGRQDQSKAVGYIQYYRDLDYVPDQQSFGVDLFLADPGNLNQGLGASVLGAFAELIREQEQAGVIVVDPDPSNARAIGCYQKAGFRHHRTLTGADGELHYLMVLRG